MAAYHWEARRRQIIMEHRLRLMQVVGVGESCAQIKRQLPQGWKIGWRPGGLGEQNLRRKSATSFKGEHPKSHCPSVRQHDVSEFATKRDHAGSLSMPDRPCSKSKR